MRISQLLLRQASWRQNLSSMENFNHWFIKTKWGFRFRIALLSAPVVIYPLTSALMNGPFSRMTFPRRYDVTDKLPPHLEKIVNEEYEEWIKRRDRKREDSVVKFYLQNKYVDTDSILKGTMSLRVGGAHIALPFFSQFRSFEEAREYCKKYLEPLKLFNSIACIIWDSDFGHKIIETMVMSEDAIRFLVYRDLTSSENYQSLINAPVIVSSYTIFSSFFTYILHKYIFKANPTALKFFIIYAICTSFAVFGAIQYHKLYYYTTGYYADEETSKHSFDHTNGGMEYYRNLLRRHRLLREVLDKGHELFTPAGNLNGVGLNYVFRYGKLKDMIKENDEIAPAFLGDDF